MKLPRRKFLHLAAGAAALPAVSRIASAQTYPTRPVRLIVPIAAGGSQDILARLVGQWLSERLGQPFVIDNRPGGGGNIARGAGTKANDDAHRPRRIGLRFCHPRYGRQRGSARGQMQECAAGKFHRHHL